MATAEETFAMVGKESLWEAAGFVWDAEQHEFRDHAGVTVQLLVAGERAGKGSEVLLPDPRDHKAVRKTFRRLVKHARGG